MAANNNNPPSKVVPPKPAASRDLVASLAAPLADPLNSEPGNHATVTVNASDPGNYPCRLYLYPATSSVPDFRLYEVDASLTAAKIQTSFTFRAPARQTIVQV